MDALAALKSRRSIREYQDKPIAKNVLEKIVDAARFAPTARNEQPWEFIVVRRRAALERIAAITDHGKFIALAAACILVFCRDTKYYLEDGAAATQNLMLAAIALGVGSCWVAGDKKPYCQALSELLAVAGPFKLVSLVSLGYPKCAKAFSVTKKKNLEDVIHWEKFGER
jgi:nitroreductase